MGDDPNHDLAPPAGLFLLARLAGDPAGCVGVCRLDPRTAEIKRMYMYVRPGARRRSARHGYVEIAPYSDNPYADHRFEKRLA